MVLPLLALLKSNASPAPTLAPPDRARTLLEAMLRAAHADPAERVDALLMQLSAALGPFDRVEGTHGAYLARYARGTDLITISLDERQRIASLLLAPPEFSGAPSAALPPGVSIVTETAFGGRRTFDVRGERVDADAPFEIGSITKTFTATLLAQMIEAGDVTADDPISVFLRREMKTPTYGGRPITLADLAPQSSGLPRLPPGLPSFATDPYAALR